MANEYWLNDEAWAVIEPLIPMKRRGVKPGNNREVISGILQLASGDVVEIGSMPVPGLVRRVA